MKLFYGTLFALFIMGISTTWAQVGGRYGYTFLGQVASARSAGLGGLLPQNTQADAAAFLYNPAGQSTKGIVGLSYNPYGGRYRYSSAAGMMDALDGTFGVGVQYIDYGKMDGYTPGGDPTGAYFANAYTVSLNYSRALGPFRYGANVKLAGSSIESYSSFGMGVDMGLNYKHPKADFSAGITLQNLGATLVRFDNTSARNWPTVVNAGISYKFEHMPVRFYATGQQLQQWDITYLDPSYSVTLDATGTEKPQNKSFSDKLLRHGAIGAELLIGKSIVVRGGYNHLYHKEMTIDNASTAGVGFSLGTAITFKDFVFDYTHSFIANAGGANFINLSYKFGGLKSDNISN